MSKIVKKVYGKFKKALDKSVFGIGATTTGKDYGLGDSIFNKGGKVIKNISKTKTKGPGNLGSPPRQPGSGGRRP